MSPEIPLEHPTNPSKENPLTSIEQIIIAEPHGECGGVIASVNTTFEILDIVAEREPVFTFNPIVHNRRLNDEFAKLGLVLIEDRTEDGDWDFEAIPEDSIVLLPAHGAKPSDTQTLLEKGCVVLDLTCSLVDNEHDQVRKAHEAGREVILFAKKGHPEPRGTMGQIPEDSIHLVSSEADLATLEIDPETTYEFASQTTQSGRETQAVKDLARDIIPLLHIDSNRLGCYATDNRQLAIERLIGDEGVDAVVVVGDGKISNNTQNLAGVATDMDIPVFIVSGAEEIDWEEFGPDSGIKKLGITSSASAREYMLDEVLHAFEEKEARISHQRPVARENKTEFPLPRANVEALKARYQS